MQWVVVPIAAVKWSGKANAYAKGCVGTYE